MYSATIKLRLPISCLRVEKYAFASHANTGVLAQECEKDNFSLNIKGDDVTSVTGRSQEVEV